MTSRILQFVLWGSASAVAFTYFVYPVLLLLLTRLRKLRVQGSALPSVSLVISAFNEKTVIREKLENSLALDYPREQLEIIVISDESVDGTDEIVASYREQGVVLYRQEPRRGKSLGLTTFVPQAKGEIVVFSDANSMYQPDALRKLVRHFADETVGFVVGHQRYLEDDSSASDSESLYWRYETWLKVQESKLGHVVGGDGAIYAIQKELFAPLRADDISDFTLPLRIVRGGYHGVFDSEAVCYERTADDFSGEFRRKVRIINRSFRAVLRVPLTLSPLHVGSFAFHLFAHKVLRWFVPFLLFTMFVNNSCLAWQGSPLYRGVLGLQIAFYLLAAGYAFPPLRKLKLVYVAYYFCLVNLAAAIGILSCLLGVRISIWNPPRRGEPEQAATT